MDSLSAHRLLLLLYMVVSSMASKEEKAACSEEKRALNDWADLFDSDVKKMNSGFGDEDKELAAAEYSMKRGNKALKAWEACRVNFCSQKPTHNKCKGHVIKNGKLVRLSVAGKDSAEKVSPCEAEKNNLKYWADSFDEDSKKLAALRAAGGRDEDEDDYDTEFANAELSFNEGQVALEAWETCRVNFCTQKPKHENCVGHVIKNGKLVSKSLARVGYGIDSLYIGLYPARKSAFCSCVRITVFLCVSADDLDDDQAMQSSAVGHHAFTTEFIVLSVVLGMLMCVVCTCITCGGGMAVLFAHRLYMCGRLQSKTIDPYELVRAEHAV